MRSEVTLRPARPEDAAPCAAIFNGWVDATDWMPRVHPPDDVERHYREHVLSACQVTVAERDDEVAGFLAVGAGGCVEAFYLADRATGRGIGSALLAAAKAARPQGLRLWTFLANEPARRFYARHGFAEARRTGGENEEALPDVLLTWELA